ncbi:MULTISPECIES: exodeoxyribonuclease VII small subunit [unclassified Fusibacter]|uniref:exodeoxyribonuclease VII small subunit n=1 Tax=unclassified Fusibacter TaxID=2624464 RepID=UPI001011A053|nr:MULTISPECIES: exodeoxyribonuclease VII small subunit [unclassified Fusibacter]MCK8058884.1 exodeoxyribonuclease VII small subunit [Fusibacter sp. A2]NPE21959.1 exodeoxyribonuclease VII small subunit [Fusibacter sp. A1]RXV61527.1 exodeoxyribonuclease VII small subunit [Fusibacter sp. A1]
MSKKVSFEEAYSDLKKASILVESKDVSLDDAIKAFEDGLRFYEKCVKILDEAEQKVKMVMGDKEVDLENSEA